MSNSDQPELPAGYNLIRETPTVDDYCRLRDETVLSPKTREAAEAGLKGTIFAVQILHETQVIGMGRLIGDGGCHFQVVDMAVLPAHQGKGIGTVIMSALSDYIETHLPDSAYISLIADGDAHRLYRRFGFSETAPESICMYRRV